MTTTEATTRAGRYIPDALTRHEIRERLQTAVANLPALPILRVEREDDEVIAYDADGYAWAGSFNFARRMALELGEEIDRLEEAWEAECAERSAIRAADDRDYERSRGVR